MTIRIGIMGYGNLGRGVECALRYNPDMELKAVFTRRNPDSVKLLTPGVKVYAAQDAVNMQDEIDVLILCGGSATDLPEQTPYYAQYFNVIDSFDTHARVPEHFANVDAAAKKSGKVGIISVGWDPGMFSLNRLYASSILPQGKSYTFWGKGVSQGHSDAIRRIPGVLDARQYTIPVPAALEAVRSGSNPELTTREKHTRECFVVAEEGADLKAIEEAIVTMPNYFEPYDTTGRTVDPCDTTSRTADTNHTAGRTADPCDTVGRTVDTSYTTYAGTACKSAVWKSCSATEQFSADGNTERWCSFT